VIESGRFRGRFGATNCFNLFFREILDPEHPAIAALEATILFD
jgi:hypothetical protein